jgi:threonine aldolase
MRFISAQFEALLEDDLWVENGRLAVAAARRLRAAVQDLPFVELAFPTEANSVFARIPVALMQAVQRESFFWPWDEQEGLVRWMCGFDSQPEDVDRFVALLKAKAEA